MHCWLIPLMTTQWHDNSNINYSSTVHWHGLWLSVSQNSESQSQTDIWIWRLKFLKQTDRLILYNKTTTPLLTDCWFYIKLIWFTVHWIGTPGAIKRLFVTGAVEASCGSRVWQKTGMAGCCRNVVRSQSTPPANDHSLRQVWCIIVWSLIWTSILSPPLSYYIIGGKS